MSRKPQTEEQKLVRAIFDNGRIKPYPNGDLQSEFKEIPRWLKRPAGLCLDEMASILQIEENELIDQLGQISIQGVY